MVGDLYATRHNAPETPNFGNVTVDHGVLLLGFKKALKERPLLPQDQNSPPQWPQSKQSQAWEIPLPFVPGELVPRLEY